MPKMKNKIKEDKKEYFLIALGIIIALFCLLLLGRVGRLGQIYLFIKFLLGDYSALCLIFLFIVSILNFVINKPLDLKHIYFIGGVLIYIGLSLLCHLGLYNELNMNNKNILDKTVELYSHYMKSYDLEYSTGGGIIAAIIAQVIAIISGKAGIILTSISFILIGLTYLADINLISLIKHGKIKKISIFLFKRTKDYFKGIHYPINNTRKKISIQMLNDSNEVVNFSLQQQINTTIFNELKEYLEKRKASAELKTFFTSYSSSRFVCELSHKSTYTLKEISAYFNKCCFFISDGLIYNVEISNQFRKLLTLKKLLLEQTTKNLVLGLDISNQPVIYDNYNGGTLLIVGDYGSGIKTFLRSILVSLFLKNVELKSIYFYDMFEEFQILMDKDISYINNEKSASISFDEAFSEYERRMDTLRFLNCDNIVDANKKMSTMDKDFIPINPIYHFIVYRSEAFDDTLIQKLSYVLQFGVKVGMIIILVIRNKDFFNRINIGNTDILAFKTDDVTQSVKMFGSDIASRLQKKGDALYQHNATLYHLQSPYISIDDFENIVSKL